VFGPAVWKGNNETLLEHNMGLAAAIVLFVGTEGPPNGISFAGDVGIPPLLSNEFLDIIRVGMHCECCSSAACFFAD